MKPTKKDASTLLRQPAVSKDTHMPRTLGTKAAQDTKQPQTKVIARPQLNSSVVVIRRRGKGVPSVTERPREPIPPARAGLRKARAKKTLSSPPPPPPRALYRIIMEQWPTTFPARPDEVRPLAVGIHELLEKKFPDRTPEQIRRAIAQWRYPRLGAYLRVVARGGSRYDLDGNPCGEVSTSEQENALIRLKEWRARRKAQAAATATTVVSSLDGGTPEPMPLPPIADDL
jgi:ProP effector